MSFEAFLREQMKKHPSMQPQDVVKMCYQAAFGAEHLLLDLDVAKSYLEKEYAEVVATKDELYEQISDTVCRINLSAWKADGLPLEWLFRMFVASCRVEQNGKEKFAECLQAAERCIGAMCFAENEWTKYLAEYKKNGMPSVHHSEYYRANEHPSYRIVDSRFCRILPILKKTKEYVDGNKPCIIAIDGRAASGKTTLANCLQTVLAADVIHMDDFFLPPILRTEERLNEAGGNIHYERFVEEVLPFIFVKKPFSYRVFDCSIMDFGGMGEIGDKQFRIVEGSYSHHPKFGKYANITAFCDVTPEEQIGRIRKRNGEKMLQMFRSRWIPMEEKYFEHYSIKDNADLRA